MSQTDTKNSQELINRLQIILENQATKDDPFSVFSIASDSDVFTSTLFPAAIRTTEQLMQIFHWGDPDASVNLEAIDSPKLYSLRLCAYPHLLKSIILTMSSLLMVYRGIAYAYSSHNAKMRLHVQKNHKSDVLIEDLARQTVYIDKNFQTAFMPSVRSSKSKLAPLVPLYIKLTDYILSSLNGEKNNTLKTTMDTFADVIKQLEQASKGAPARIVKKPLDPDEISNPSDPKLTAVDNYISSLTSSIDNGLKDPFRSLFPPIQPVSISSAAGAAEEDANDAFSHEMLEAAGHAVCIPDFFDRLQNSDDFMCSNPAGRNDSDDEDDEDEEDEEENDEDMIGETADGGSSSSSSSESSESSESSSEDDTAQVSRLSSNKRKRSADDYTLTCKFVKSKKNKKNQQPYDPWLDDGETFNMFQARGKDEEHVQNVLSQLAKEVAENLELMNSKLNSVSSTTLSRYVRSAYEKLNGVIGIINDSLLSTEKTFVTDLLRKQLKDYMDSIGMRSNFDDEGCEDDEDDSRPQESIESVRRRIASLYASKLPMLVFLKENIQQTLDFIRRETAEFAILEAKLITRAIVTDAAAQRIYDAMTAEPRCLIQLAVPTAVIPLIYKLNMNHSIARLYNSIVDSLVEARVLLQLNALMLVPVEYYLFALGGFFDNRDMLVRYKHNYSAVVEKMFDYAVTFSSIMYRQQVEATSSGVVTSPGRIAEKMMIKNGNTPNEGNRDAAVLPGSLGNKKFDFIRNTAIVEKELATRPNNYVECLTAFTSGLNANISVTPATRSVDSATMFMLTNFIYSLDIVVLLNLIGIQLKAVPNVDLVMDLVYSYFELLIGESGGDGDAESIPKMFEIPFARLLAALIVLNPRAAPEAASQRLADARLHDALAKIISKKPKLVKLMEQTYGTTISSQSSGEITVVFTTRSGRPKARESEEYTIKSEFFDKLMATPAQPPNLLEYVEVTSPKRGETIGEIEAATEFASLSSSKTDATLVDHLLPKCALLGCFDWLSSMVNLTMVVPTANNLTLQLVPTTFKAQLQQFKISA